MLAWQPTTPLEEGLKHTIVYFDKLLTERGAIEDNAVLLAQ
jgi:hypothetical protein